MLARPSTAVIGGIFCLCLSTIAPAQRQFEEWPVKRYLPAGMLSARALAFGDVDGDGDQDLVVGGGGQNRLLLGRGNGAFEDATSARMPARADPTRAVALADVDGDGDLDLVLGNHRQQNRLYLNDGTGTFADATAGRLPPESDATTSVVFGDVDGDLDPDLVVGNDSAQQDRLYLNDGAGTFTDATAARMPVDAEYTNELALGDVDGDSDLDLVLVGAGRDRLYLNGGTGTFTDVTAARMPTGVFPGQTLALGDVDGDLDLDIVIGNQSVPNLLYLNDGTGTFTDGTAGRLPTYSDWTAAVALGDVDADGDLDLVIGNSQGGRNRLYRNDGTGTFADVTAAQLPRDADDTRAVALGDVDGDADPDLFFGNLGGPLLLHLNDSAGSFTSTSGARVPVDTNDTQAAAAGDVDGDGDVDLVFGNYFEPATLYLDDGTGAFVDATATHMPAQAHGTLALALGDVDGDGDLDVLVGNSGVLPSGGANRQDRLYLNDGTGRFSDATAAWMPPEQDSTTSVVMGDVDGDGDLDAVLGYYSAGIGNSLQNRLYINNGAGRFIDATTKRLPVEVNETYAVAMGDVDGDGDPDFVCANAGPRPQNRLFLNDGTGTFANVTESRMPVDTDDSYAIALADVDGDGDLDMVIGNYGGQDKLYLNDGTGTFADATAGRMPLATTWTTTLSLGDVDGDLDLDLDLALGTWRSTGAQQTRLYLNDGTGTFGDATPARLPVDGDYTSAVLLTDVDGDDDPDLVIGNASRHPNRLYTNLHRQLSAPVFPSRGQSYQLELHAKPGYGTAVHTSVVVLGLALAQPPIPIPPLGTFYLAPSPLLGLPPVSIPQATGRGVLQLTMPGNPSLLGIVLYFQALILNTGAPSDAHFTGYLAEAIR